MSHWPNFFVIGAGKAGTTSLYHYLKQHPEIFMSRLKEPKFFALEGHALDFTGPYDERIRRGTTTDRVDYLRLFEQVRGKKRSEKRRPSISATPGHRVQSQTGFPTPGLWPFSVTPRSGPSRHFFIS